MPDLQQFRLPDVGEGLTEADILTWSVAPGDRVVVNQTLVEVETAKAAVELPSPFAGIVAALHAEPGETVAVGRAIITIDTSPLATGDGAPDPAEPRGEEPAGGLSAGGQLAVGQPGATAVEAPREAVLVGYGPRSGPARRRVRRASATQEQTPNAQAAFAIDPGSVAAPSANPPEDSPASAAVPPALPAFPPGLPAATPAKAEVPPASAAAPPVRPESHPANGSPRALAKPPVRMLAKSLGVDLDEINPTGPNGSVSRDDVERAAAGAAADTTAADITATGATATGVAATGVAANGSGPGRAAPPTERGAREERIAIKGVRKHTAAAMVASAFTAPHATVFVSADVTAMMELRQRFAARREFAGVKISPLALVARAAIWAIARTPIVNSSWDEAAGEIVVKRYVNLGIAAATGRGLVVPNIKDADGLSLRALAQALGELAETARAGRTSPAEMAGGTFTITNVGVFGVDAGTPILNPGESAILAFGAVRRAPWVVRRGDDEAIEARWVTQLALSVDHRVVDGEQASTFLADLAAVLTDPGLALS